MTAIYKLLSLGVSDLNKLFRRQAPTDREVSRELQKLLGDKTLEFPEWLNINLESLLNIIRDPLMIILIIFLLLGVYLLFHSLAPYLRFESGRPGQYSKAVSKESKRVLTNVAQFFNQALIQAGDGEYGQAIISLHKATVEYLTAKIITLSSGKKYSNNDLKRKLKKESDLYQPFVLIARYAEIACFSSIMLSHTEFDKALQAFKMHFLS